MQERAQSEPLLSEVPTFRQHEGHRAEMRREDGSTVEFNYDEPLTASFELDVDMVRKIGPAAAIEAAHVTADQLAEQMATRTFALVEEAVAQTGNSVDGKGQPLSAEMFLEMLEKMQLSFDENGEWQPPSIVMHPDMAAKAAERLSALETDQTLRARQAAIVNKQREEWRAREAHRELAD